MRHQRAELGRLDRLAHHFHVAAARHLREEIGQAIVAHGTASAPNGDTIYAYEVDGQRFTSNHIRFGAWLNPLDTDMRLVVATYPVGKRVVVRHHPAQPQIATLETRVSAFLWGMLVICVGMAGLIAHRALTGSW